LSDGVWSVTAKVTDPAGNQSSAGAALSLTVDSTGPGAPAAPDLVASSDTGSSSSDNVTSDSTPEISVAGGSAGDTVTVTASKRGVPVSCSYVVGSASSCTLPALSSGTWSVSGRVSDIAGNQSPASEVLSIKIVASSVGASGRNPGGSSSGGATNGGSGSASGSGTPTEGDGDQSTSTTSTVPGGTNQATTDSTVPDSRPRNSAGGSPSNRRLPFPAPESTLFLATALTLAALKRRDDGPRKLSDDERESNSVAEFSAGSGSGGLDVRSDVYVAPRWDRFDRWMCSSASRWSRFSPALGRIVDDASYLRALTGVFYLLLPLAGVVLGCLAANDTGYRAVMPQLWILVAVMVVGTLDATSGLVASVVYGISLVLGGGYESTDSIRGFLSIVAPMFLVGLVASAMRPYRRVSEDGATWQRTIDFVLIPLMGAWAAGAMYTAIPHLSGYDVAWSDRRGTFELAALLILVARYALENAGRLAVPARLAFIENESLPDPDETQKILSRVVRTGLFAFIAVVFIEMNAWLVAGTLMFLVPRLVEKYEDRFPDLSRAYRFVPRQLTRIVVMMFVSMWWGSAVMGSLSSNEIQWAFILMGIPGLVLGVVDMFVRSGNPWPSTWYSKAGGVLVLCVGLGIVRGWWF